MASAEIIEEEDLNRIAQGPAKASDADAAAVDAWLKERGIFPEDFDTDYGLLDPGDTVIIRPYGGEDDDILLNELRPRFVVCYEPNLAFIRRLEVRLSAVRLVPEADHVQVYKNCNPGLALRVYQMVYANSFEEDRFLSSMQREDDAFKKLIDDRSVSRWRRRKIARHS
jgi:DNA excision repair protein ERCC-4